MTSLKLCLHQNLVLNLQVIHSLHFPCRQSLTVTKPDINLFVMTMTEGIQRLLQTPVITISLCRPCDNNPLPNNVATNQWIKNSKISKETVFVGSVHSVVCSTTPYPSTTSVMYVGLEIAQQSSCTLSTHILLAQKQTTLVA